MTYLVLNAGSSSIKYSYYDPSFCEIFRGLIEGIGEQSGGWTHQGESKNQRFSSHKDALTALSALILKKTKGEQPTAIGHRVVHGGSTFIHPQLIDPSVLAKLKELIPLAPLHNPANILGIESAQEAFSECQQVAVFDTAFHANMPPHSKYYAIDTALAEKHHIQRYGFHGINHHYVGQQAALYLNGVFDKSQFISLHLGNGASSCLIKNGHSVDTSMGVTPLPGLIMGTRCGDIDPAIIFYLQRQGYSLDELDTLLNKQSGLKGIAGDNDMRRLVARAEDSDPQASLAIAMYCYRIQKEIGAYLSQCPTLDALIFTGGVGENSAFVRKRVIQDLAHLGLNLCTTKNALRSDDVVRPIHKTGAAILVIKGNEELAIAKTCHQLLTS